MRMISDDHYLTDTLAGAALGTTVGLGLPYLLHYRGGATPPKEDKTGVTVRVVPAPNGGALAGVF